MAVRTIPVQDEAVLIYEADAWFAYLEACQEAAPNRYEAVESWAWARLQAKLRGVRS